MNKLNNKQVYIPSIEASDIYGHMVRGKNIKFEFNGSIPYSLELRKLREQKVFKSFKQKGSTKNKIKNTAIINVKFDMKVRDGVEVLKNTLVRIEEKKEAIASVRVEVEKLKNKMKDYPNNKKVEQSLKNKKKELKSLKKASKYYKALKREIKNNGESEKWDGVTTDNLRIKLYKEGFRIKQFDFKTGEIVSDTHYKFYKRSSSKSRNGEAWFICEELYDTMVNWSRMNLPLIENQEIDLPGLMAYESLTASGIIDVMGIDPDSILIVDELENKFHDTVDVVYKNGKNLDVKTVENKEIVNSVFDGYGLLDSSLFEGNYKDKSFLLLRSHFFKAATLNTNIQDFYRDYYGDDYETAYVKDLFGNEVKISSIKLIINPSCLKALKFGIVLGGKAEMYAHWKEIVRQEGVMGIVKYEKSTKRGRLNGKPLQQTSYQMINSLIGMDKQAIDKLIDVAERDYIHALRNDNDAFIQYLEENKNKVNPYQMFVDIYSVNPKITESKLFRTFRTKTIGKRIEHIKKGKIRLYGDYATIFSCCVQYLYFSCGASFENIDVLKRNEVYTTLFGEEGFDKEYVAFRSPHNSPSNTYICKNTRNELIEKYFNLNPNIVIVNAWNENIMNRLNGCDFDSDQIVIFDNEEMLATVKKSYDEYKVCVNDIEADPAEHVLSLEGSANIDNLLSNSTREIGEITNICQIALSLVSDYKYKGRDANKVNDLLKYTQILAVLSGVSIDSAKRQYAVKIPEQIKLIQSKINLKLLHIERVNNKEVKDYMRKKELEKIPSKPNFWKYVQSTKYTNKKVDSKPLILMHYNCPMDYLYGVKFERASSKPNYAKLEDTLNTKDRKNANRKQIANLVELAEDSQNKIASVMISKDGEELDMAIEDVMDELLKKFNKLEVNENTMYSILMRISEESEGDVEKEKGKTNCHMRLLYHLHSTQTETFINAFKKIS